eukprot:14341056-Alexandrium_andersonii.AAC.1
MPATCRNIQPGRVCACCAVQSQQRRVASAALVGVGMRTAARARPVDFLWRHRLQRPLRPPPHRRPWLLCL